MCRSLIFEIFFFERKIREMKMLFELRRNVSVCIVYELLLNRLAQRATKRHAENSDQFAKDWLRRINYGFVKYLFSINIIANALLVKC